MKPSRIMFATQWIVLAMTLALFATPASAQLQPWEDYEASEGVWTVTYVDLDPGTFGIYMEGLKNTWVAANEVAKELGQIQDYAIYSNQYSSGDDYDLALVIQYSSTEDLAPNQARYNEFLEAWGQANIDESNETVLELYNKIRRIQGTHLLRKITIK